MLEWICHVICTHSLWESPEDIPFTNAVWNKFGLGAPAFLNSSIMTPLSRLYCIVATAVTELRNLDIIEGMGSWSDRGHRAALSHNRQGGEVTVGKRRIKAAIRIYSHLPTASTSWSGCLHKGSKNYPGSSQWPISRPELFEHRESWGPCSNKFGSLTKNAHCYNHSHNYSPGNMCTSRKEVIRSFRDN